MSGLIDRVAAAPITWGVSEVPGWGYQLDAARVLREMRELGIRASELGPDGYFALDRAVAAEIKRSGFSIIAGFMPVVFRPGNGISEALPELALASSRLAETGARLAVLILASDQPGYEDQHALGDDGWDELAGAVPEVISLLRERGLTPLVHPHYGTYLSTGEDVARLLEMTELDLTLDTGHLALAGYDPLEIVAAATGRVRHVHLKDVDLDLADQVRQGAISYHQAVGDGLFLPLGRGGVRLEETIRLLEESGYSGWYVLEQDLTLSESPPEGGGPIECARLSIEFLKTLEQDLNSYSPPMRRNEGVA